jgi:dihydrofolate reductase
VTARLIYSALASLDGYVADDTGGFGWAAPDEDVHAFINDLERPIATYLYGRRMYEVMAVWETMDATSEVGADFAQLWRAADKIVFSRTLERTTTPRTRLERAFEPEAIRALKARSDRDITVGGAELAGQALQAGLVDECHLFLAPVVVGGGTRALPDCVRLDLDLRDERRFAGGMVHLHYLVRADHPAG